MHLYANKDWMVLFQQQNQLGKLMETNQAAGKYGLILSEQDAALILEERKESLRKQERVEFGGGIVPKIIYEFCDSRYIRQDKNEMRDEITDDELLHFMKEQFEDICFGDLEYLESTCLANFAQAVRAGYDGHRSSGGYGEYEQFDEVKRWDYELYLETLRELLWR